MSLTKVTNSMIQSADINVLNYMTEAQITAVLAYSFGTDVTAACQAALNYARANNLDCYFPAGGYLVTGLTIPGTTNPPTVDDRDSAIRIYGQGFGEPFVHTNTGGTVIKSVTNAPVITDIIGATPPQSNGTVELDHIRFDGTSSTPVVLLQSSYGLSSTHNVAIYQRGTGSGIRWTYSAGVWVYMVWAMNKDYATFGLGAARVGIGFDFPNTNDSGLFTISKCSSRGWLTGYSLGGGAGAIYSPTIEQSECSVTYNGINLNTQCQKAVIDSNYLEGQEGGTGIANSGAYSTITNNFIFSGCSYGVDSRYVDNKGTVITGNVIGLGAVAGAYGIAVGGRWGQGVTGNSISCTDGTANQIGIFVDVADGKADVHSNAFDPKETWTGSGASKIAYTATSIVRGVITGQSNGNDFPILSGGAVALSYAPLTGSDVVANVLTVPDGGYFIVTAAAPVSVNSLDAGIIDNRVVTFRTVNANMTFNDTAVMFLSGAFTGPGTISFVIERLAGQSYAYETSRTVF